LLMRSRSSGSQPGHLRRPTRRRRAGACSPPLRRHRRPSGASSASSSRWRVQLEASRRSSTRRCTTSGPPDHGAVSPPRSRQAGGGQSRILQAGERRHHPAVLKQLVCTSSHGHEAGRDMGSLRRLPAAEPSNNAGHVPAAQHPGPLLQAARLQHLQQPGSEEGLLPT
jgi:hypothetical protein